MAGTKSAFFGQKTLGQRGPIYPPSIPQPKTENRNNDHTTPNKKRKTEDLRQPGKSADSAISLDDSQALDESEDELALGTNSVPQRSAVHVPQPRGTSQVGQSSAGLTTRTGMNNAQKPHSDRRSSSEDESIFTKVSARQRRAQKDDMLGSSPEPLKQLATHHVSPYFGKPHTSVNAGKSRQDQARHVEPTPESPDALQGGKTRSIRMPNGESLSRMRTRDLGNLIVGDKSTATLSKASNSRGKKALTQATSFPLEDLVYRNFIPTSGYMVEVDISLKQISIELEKPALGDGSLLDARGISKIAKLEHGTDQSPLVIIHFSRSDSSGEDKMCLRFQSHKVALDFVKLLQKAVHSLRVYDRESYVFDAQAVGFLLTCNSFWMDQSFAKSKVDPSSNYRRSHPKAPRKEDNTPAESPSAPSAQSNIGERRTRVVDKLDRPTPSSKRTTVISGSERMAALQSINPTLQPVKKRAPPRDSVSAEKATEPALPPRRLTRSQDDHDRPSTEQEHTETRRKVKASKSGMLGDPWTKDLVYPQPGRRAAIVPFEDLDRLDDDEFLNDNLILFFMRYLETHMEKSNPELYKRMYFFNTYFYEALTKTSKGKKGINYDAVDRWTKNINLFSRDFIVVPVNENFHWYLAIICNLPHFPGDSGNTGWAEHSTATEAPTEEGDDEIDPPTVETQKSMAELSISDGEMIDENSTKKRGPGRRKSARRSLPKYEIDKPVIITLDSLGYSRSGTCTLLKQYVVLEGKSKKGLDIDATELRGMTAKEIPTQSNFSDCGLYLCVYLEQFVADPYSFIRRILQRNESAQQWPRRIHSEDLRSRLRDLILETHRRQEKEPPQMEEPVIGSILIDKRELSPTPSPVPQKPRTKQEIQNAKQRFQSLTDQRTERSESLAEVTNGAHALSEVSGIEDDSDDEQNTDIIIFKDSSQDELEHPYISRPTEQAPTTRDGSAVQVRASPSPAHALSRGSPSHNTPAELAAQLRRENDGHSSNKRRRRTPSDNSGEKRKSRSSSQSSQLTDYLTGPSGAKDWLAGIESFAAQPSPSPERSTNPNETVRPSSSGGAAKERIRESTSLSPGPVVVAERAIPSYRQTPGSTSKKRKRPPGMKVRPPNSAQDLKELNGFDDVAEVPETQETDVWQVEAGHSQGQEVARQDFAEDGEMLL